MSLSRRAFIAGLLAAPVVAKLPAAAEPDVLVAAQSSSIFPTGFAVWKSLDGGATWSQVNPPRLDGKLWLENGRYRITGRWPISIHLGSNARLSGDIFALPDREPCVFIGSDVRGWRFDHLNARFGGYLDMAEAPADKEPADLWSTGAYTPPVMPLAPAAETFRLPAPVEPAWLAHDKRRTA